MARFPIDTEQRRIGSRACAILHYRLNSDHWIYREETEIDVGRDCVIELSENDRWYNYKIEGQIKGTKRAMPLKRENAFSFPIETKTIMYALNSHQPFVLFYVDIHCETVYYLPIQDYFIANTAFFDKLDSAGDTLSLHIPCDNILNDQDEDLQQIAKSQYTGGPGISLRKL